MNKIPLAILFFGIFQAALAIQLKELGRISERNGLEGAEISTYVADEKMLVVASGDEEVYLVSLADPSKPQIVDTVRFAEDVPSVSSFGNLVAAVEVNAKRSRPGLVHFFRLEKRSLVKLRSLSTGVGPDMVAFSPDGKSLLVACEGEVDEDTWEDPAGSIGLVDLSDGISSATSHILTFDAFDSLALASAGVRLFGPGSYLQNIEPEYIAFSPDGKLAFATLQENNAVAKIDVEKKKIVEVFGLGAVDHSLPGNEFDYRTDRRISLENAPVRGLLEPDGIAAFVHGGKLYFATADEGESRELSTYTDETTAARLWKSNRLSKEVFTKELVKSLGELPIDAENPCDGKEPCVYLNTFGGRSMSLFDGNTGKRVWNSGSAIEKISAEKYPELFNRNSKKEKVKADARSKKKGPEPENVTVGSVGKENFAFVGVERSGGIAVFSLKNPEKPQMAGYFAKKEDRGPEGVLFISAENSPLPGTPLLVVCYEYGKTLVVYRIFY